MINNLLEIIACPRCKNDLHFLSDKNKLVCDTCRHSYEIKDDIPILMTNKKINNHDDSNSPPQTQDNKSVDEVKGFWIKSVDDFKSGKKTGVDVSQRQDYYWKYLDLFEKETMEDNLQSGKVLDLGCGTGRLTDVIFENGNTVIAADYVFELIKIVEEKNSNYTCINMSLVDIGIKDSSINSVVACRALQSSKDKEDKIKAVNEISRILKKDGTLILDEGNPLRTKFVPIAYNFFIPLRDWLNILDSAGFSIVKVYAIPFLTGAKLVDNLTLGFLGRNFEFPFKLAYSVDKIFGSTFLKHLSLQFNIIARKI